MGLSVAGLDLSLRSAGMAVIDADRHVFTYTFGSKLTTEASDRQRSWRNIKITNDIIATLKRHSVKVVGIENYAFSIRSVSTHVLAELGGLVKAQILLACGVCPASMGASEMRKFMFGKNISDKKKIKDKLVTMGFEQPKNLDESDALVVALVMDAYSNKRASYFHPHELDLFGRLDKRV